jgi:nitroreductase
MRKIMKRVLSMWLFWGFVFLFIFPIHTYSQELKAIQLPKPQMDGGKPLMEVLKNRKSSREFSTEKLPDQVLSNLLWAAWGLNRPYTGTGIKHQGCRTAPTGHNSQSMKVYAAMAEGLYLYDAMGHTLIPIHNRDIRAAAGHPVQTFVADAPVNLIYVEDISKFPEEMPSEDECQKQYIPYAQAGFISENVYLYCASEGLATVIRLLFDKAKLAKEMGLGEGHLIALEQPVGYPKKK